MANTFPRSCYDQTGGLCYFPRMIDKIRLMAAGQLPEAYHPMLGDGFDKWCIRFLGIDYGALKERVLAGGTNEEVLQWCFEVGRALDDEQIEMFNGFLSKRGWRDATSERITFRLKEAGLENRDKDVGTMFDFIEVDEGRTPPDFKKWEQPRF